MAAGIFEAQRQARVLRLDGVRKLACKPQLNAAQLIELASDSSPQVREIVAPALARLPNSRDLLFQMAKFDASNAVAEAAMQALCGNPLKRDLSFMLSIMDNKDARYRPEAACALASRLPNLPSPLKEKVFKSLLAVFNQFVSSTFPQSNRCHWSKLTYNQIEHPEKAHTILKTLIATDAIAIAGRLFDIATRGVLGEEGDTFVLIKRAAAFELIRQGKVSVLKALVHNCDRRIEARAIEAISKRKDGFTLLITQNRDRAKMAAIKLKSADVAGTLDGEVEKIAECLSAPEEWLRHSALLFFVSDFERFQSTIASVLNPDFLETRCESLQLREVVFHQVAQADKFSPAQEIIVGMLLRDPYESMREKTIELLLKKIQGNPKLLERFSDDLVDSLLVCGPNNVRKNAVILAALLTERHHRFGDVLSVIAASDLSAEGSAGSKGPGNEIAWRFLEGNPALFFQPVLRLTALRPDNPNCARAVRVLSQAGLLDRARGELRSVVETTTNRRQRMAQRGLDNLAMAS